MPFSIFHFIVINGALYYTRGDDLILSVVTNVKFFFCFMGSRKTRTYIWIFRQFSLSIEVE